MSINEKVDQFIEEELGYSAIDSLENPDLDEDRQLYAGMGSAFSRAFRKPTQEIFERVRTRPQSASPDAPSQEDVRRVLEAYEQQPVPDPVGEKRTPERNVNIQRHHEGALMGRKLMDLDPNDLVSYATQADDLGRMLDAVGSEMGLAEGTVTHAQIAGEVSTAADVRRELMPIFEGKQTGLLNTRQTFALRRVLTTIGNEVTELANRISAGDETSETLGRYTRAQQSFIVLQQYVQGNIKEIARTLSAQRMISASLRGQDAAMLSDSLFAAGADPKTIVRHAKYFKDRTAELADEPGAVIGAMADASEKFSPTRMAVETWKAFLLTGPQTHAVNILSNAGVAIYDNILVKTVGGTIGATRGAFTGAADRMTLAEQKGAFVGAMAGLRDGIKAMAGTLWEGQSTFGAQKADLGSPTTQLGMVSDSLMRSENYISRATGAGVKAVDTAISMPYRLLGAEDDFFKTMAYRQHLTRLATRDGVVKDLKGDALNEHIAKLIEDPPDEIHLAAMDEAARLTYTERDVSGVMGLMADNILQVTQRYPALGFMTPFITTPTNLLRYAAENSVIAPISKRWREQFMKGGAARDMALAQWITGSGVMAAAYGMYQAGLITGEGPKDYTLRKVLQKTGWKPNSVKIGNKFYSYNRLDPLGMILASVANQADRAAFNGDASTATDMIMEGVFTVINHTLDATYMRGIDGFLDAVNYGGTAAAKFLANYPAALIPYSQAIKQVGKAVDPSFERIETKYLTESFAEKTYDQFVQRAKSRFPFEWGRGSLRQARYWDGSALLPEPGFMGHMNGLLPIQVYSLPGSRDAASEELVKQIVPVREPSPLITVGNVRFSLLDLDDGAQVFYDEYIKTVGKYRREMVQEVIAMPEYKEATGGPDSEKQLMLQNAIRKGQTAGRAEFLTEVMPELIRGLPQIENVLTDALGMGIDVFVDMVNEGQLGPKTMEQIKMKRAAPGSEVQLPKSIEQIPKF